MSNDPRKDAVLRFRIDPVQRDEIEWAARQEGMLVSTWLRRLAVREVRKLKAALAARRSK